MSKDDFEDVGAQHLNDAACNTESASTSSNNGNQDCQQNCDASVDQAVGTKRMSRKERNTTMKSTCKDKHRVTNESNVTRRKRRFSETEDINYNHTMEDSESNSLKKLRPNLQTRDNRTFEDERKNGMASTQGSRRKRPSLSPENEHVHVNNKRSRKELMKLLLYFIQLELGLSILHKNFKIIHRELCIEDLMTENRQISSLLSNGTRRRLKIDKLLFELETDRKLRRIFFQDLGKSETNRPLADKLKQPCSSPSSETFDSSENLVGRFSQQTWYIKQSLEPIDIIATAVEFEGVQFKDNYNISKAETRQERVNILFEAINKLETREKWRILKPIFDILPEETDNETTSTPVVTVRVPQETQRHETFLNEDIWNNLANLSLEEIDAETRRLRKLFEGFSKTSLNIHFVECGPNDVKTIRKFCEDGQLKSLLVAMIDKGAINKLIHLEQIVAHVSLYNGFKIQACLCYLNKVTFKENMSYITEKCSGFEIPFIDTLIESKSLTSKMTNAIVYIKRSSKTTDIPSEIIEFLKQDDVPQICFCFLQKVLTDMKGQDIVQQLFKGEIHEGFVVELKRDITTDVVKRNAKYLEEEIEAKCFVTALSTHVGKRAKLLIKEIMSLESRQNRNTALIEFLSTEQDMSWFQEELQRYYSYLADILTTQINTNKEVVTEFRRVLFGLNDVIQDDLDPLLLAKYLTQSLLDRISFDVLQREQNRRKRSSMFMTTILRDENSTIIPEVIEAMRHDYNGLVNVVKDVVKNGSLSTYYKCPRMNAQQLILSTTINLTDGICKRAEAETWQFRMIKQYSFMKNEISKVEAIEIAEYLYSKNLATEGDVQDIKESSRRRKADEKLLKLVLNGTYEMYLEFKTALNMFNLSRASEKLQSETIQDVSEGMNAGKEKLKFKNLEYDILMGELNERNLIDKINDKLLSNQIFSSQMHTDVVRCSFKRSQRLQKLIKFLETCSKCVLPTFLEILEELEMNNVTEKLQRMNRTDQKSKGKALSAKLQRYVVKERNQEILSKKASIPTRETYKDYGHASGFSDEAYDSGSDSYSGQESTMSETDSLMDIGIQIDKIKYGSIVIMARPTGPSSFQKLEQNCRSGKIKNFIPQLFVGKAVGRVLEAGEYRLAFTIYSIPTANKQDTQKLVMHLENEQEHIDKKMKGKSQLLDFLTEELEITKDFLHLLKKKNIVDENIMADLSNLRCRSQKTAFVLNKVSSHGNKGYKVLKKYVKTENEYIYKYLETNSDITTPADNLPSKSNLQYPKKDIIFSCVFVLEVKDKDKEEQIKDEEHVFDINCTTIENPVYNFAIIEKEKDKTSSKTCMKQLSEDNRSESGKPKQAKETNERKGSCMI